MCRYDCLQSSLFDRDRTEWVECSVLMPSARNKIIQTIRENGYSVSDLLNTRDINELEDMGFDFAADKLMLVLAEHVKHDLKSLFAMKYRYNGKSFISSTMVSMDSRLSHCIDDLKNEDAIVELIKNDIGLDVWYERDDSGYYRRSWDLERFIHVQCPKLNVAGDGKFSWVCVMW